MEFRPLDLDDADVSQRFYDGPLDHGFEYSLTLPAGIQSEPYAFFKNDRLARWNDLLKSWQYFQNDSNARKFFKSTAKKNSKKTAYVHGQLEYGVCWSAIDA